MGQHQMEKISIMVARAALSARKTAIETELLEYPTPVAGCDQQFNHLLELRFRVGRQLRQLDRLGEGEIPPAILEEIRHLTNG